MERVLDPTDGRARLVRLTDRGRAILPVARAEEERIEKEWETHLGTQRMQHLRDALTRLREISDPYGPNKQSRPGRAGGA